MSQATKFNAKTNAKKIAGLLIKSRKIVRNLNRGLLIIKTDFLIKLIRGSDYQKWNYQWRNTIINVKNIYG